MIIWFCVLAWFLCGALAGRYYYVYFQTQWPTLAKESRIENRRMSGFLVFMGPLALFAIWISNCARYGLKLGGLK